MKSQSLYTISKNYKIDQINVKRNGRGNQEWTIQRNWQQDKMKTKKQKTNKKYNKICVGHLHTQDIRRRQTKQNIQHIKIR